VAIERDEYGVQWRQLDDGRWLTLMPLTYDRLRVTIGRDRIFIDDSW
jgi:hypothetical protein